MSDTARKYLSIGINAALFIFCMFLVIWGQKTIGYKYLFIQLIGLFGLLTMLWKYNRKYR